MHGMHVLSELRVEIKGRWLLTSPWHRCPTPPSVLDYSLHCMALCMGQECAHPHMLQPLQWAMCRCFWGDGGGVPHSGGEGALAVRLGAW